MVPLTCAFFSAISLIAVFAISFVNGQCDGCSAGGTEGGVDCYDVLNDGKIYGCRGTFSGGMYDASTDSICASGYHVCDSATEASNLGLVSGGGTCASVIGTNEIYFTRETSSTGGQQCNSIYGETASQKNDVWGCGGSTNLCSLTSGCLGLNIACGNTDKYDNHGNLVYGGLSNGYYELLNISVVNDTFGGVLCCMDKCGGCNETNTDSGSINQINIDSNTDCYQLSNDTITSSIGYDSTIYACRGAFEGPMNSSSAENICGNGYHMCVSAIEIKSLGLVGDKCKSIIGDNEVFWTQETSDGSGQCNSKYGKTTSYRNDIWGCCGNDISKFTSCGADNNCYGLDAFCTSGSGNIYIGGQLAMSLGSDGYYEWDNFILYNDTFGGVLCCPNEPTSAPTYLPTKVPSADPTGIPSRDPTNYPSSNPTTMPSNHPSLIPSNDPSTNPTSVPSNNPSSNPSVNPTNKPSIMPTINPSKTPSSPPTGQPSDPSNAPTDKPSNEPSAVPTTAPTFEEILISTTNEDNDNQGGDGDGDNDTNGGEASSSTGASNGVFDSLDTTTLIIIIAALVLLCCLIFIIIGFCYRKQKQNKDGNDAKMAGLELVENENNNNNTGHATTNGILLGSSSPRDDDDDDENGNNRGMNFSSTAAYHNLNAQASAAIASSQPQVGNNIPGHTPGGGGGGSGNDDEDDDILLGINIAMADGGGTPGGGNNNNNSTNSGLIAGEGGIGGESGHGDYGGTLDGSAAAVGAVGGGNEGNNGPESGAVLWRGWGDWTKDELYEWLNKQLMDTYGNKEKDDKAQVGKIMKKFKNAGINVELVKKCKETHNWKALKHAIAEDKDERESLAGVLLALQFALDSLPAN